MEMIQVMYCCVIPFLISFRIFGSHAVSRVSLNLIAVFNLLIIGYSVFLVRQLLGLYQMGKYLGANGSGEEWTWGLPMIRLLLVILLPVLSMLRIIRKSLVFSFLLWLLLYWNNPVTYWNDYALFFKIAGYGCAICAAYALLWLLNELPFQQV
jgi:hypothetical protein